MAKGGWKVYVSNTISSELDCVFEFFMEIGSVHFMFVFLLEL